MSENPSIRTEVIQAYIDFDKFDAERCEDRLLEIASTGNSLARLSIVDRLLFDSLENQSKEIEILKTCAQDNNVNVLERIAWVLSRKGQAFLDDSLGIIKILLKKREYFSIPSLSYYLKELCKDKTNTCMETFTSWIDSDTDPVFRFRVSNLIKEISSSTSE